MLRVTFDIFLGLSLLGLFFIFGIAGYEHLSDARNSELDIRLRKGENIYAEKQCRSCHGDPGEPTTNENYPRLWGQNAEYVVNQLKDFQSTRRSNGLSTLMHTIAKDLSEEEMDFLAAYIHSIQ